MYTFGIYFVLLLGKVFVLFCFSQERLLICIILVGTKVGASLGVMDLSLYSHKPRFGIWDSFLIFCTLCPLSKVGRIIWALEVTPRVESGSDAQVGP